MKKSLKQRFMIPVFMVAALGILILSFICYSEAKGILTIYIEKMAESKVEKLVDNVDNKLQQWILNIKLLSTYNSIKEFKYDEFFKEVVKDKIFEEKSCVLSIIDRNGDYIDSQGYKGNVKDREYFKYAIDGTTIINDNIVSKTNKEPIVVIATPIKANNTIKGVLSCKISLSYLTDIINVEKIGKRGYAFMLNSTGKLIAHPSKELILKKDMLKLDNRKLSNIFKNMVGGISGMDEYTYKGQEKLVAYRPVKEVAWSIGMSASYDDLFNDIKYLRNFIIYIGLIIVGGILLALYFLVKSIINPIEEIKECMEVAADGDLSVQCKLERQDELGMLAKSLNELINENKRLLDETIEYDRLKIEFFSNISHELKTPLNVIFSTVQLMELYIKQCREAPEGKCDLLKTSSYVKIMEKNSYRLIRLVDNLIDMTKIDSGYIELSMSNENIVEVVEDITLCSVEYLKENGREILFDTEIEEKVMAIDREKLERVILNLISNAVKSTNKGDKIEVCVLDKGDNIQIEVKDTGKGIPSEKQELIFERFRQADPLYNRDHEGSGNGLSIVKALIEMHNGELRLESVVGEGTKFIITLPVKLISEEISKNNKLVEDSKEVRAKIELSDIYN